MTATFQYDALGRRTRKTINGTATAFLYDDLNPVQELAAPVPVANLLTGLSIDEFFTRTDAAGPQAFLVDALQSTLALSDAAGTISTEYTYEPFGMTTATGAPAANAFQYTGRENDGTGIYYYRARYYHPGLQRFLSEDPLSATTLVLLGQQDRGRSLARQGWPSKLQNPPGLQCVSLRDQ
jgi:RHS repeat-associated protein